MKNSLNALLLSAALTGLVGGTMAAAQPVANGAGQNSAKASTAGVRLIGQDTKTDKHSCKGKNDCKGQGGGKHPGTNSCKGKGDCATDGSTPHFA